MAFLGKKGNMERVRSYLVKSHFVSCTDEVGQNLQEMNSMVHIQFEVIQAVKLLVNGICGMVVL